MYRKVYANLARQLMVAEVKSEEAWHARYEAGLASWRTLRTQHALRLFNERLAGEWGEPEPCLAIYQQLSQQQGSAYEVRLCAPALPHDAPTHMEHLALLICLTGRQSLHCLWCMRVLGHVILQCP